MCQETRICIVCNQKLPLTEEYFAKNQSTNTGGDKYFRTDCKKCNKIKTKGRTIAYKNAGKPNYPDYGYNPETKKTENGYPCDCCGKTNYSKKIVFDHNHVNLDHRGWVCDGCNRSIGMLGDDESGLINSLAYIYGIEKKHREEYIKMLITTTELFKKQNGDTIIRG
jgi:hypothetical protein